MYRGKYVATAIRMQSERMTEIQKSNIQILKFSMEKQYVKITICYNVQTQKKNQKENRMDVPAHGQRHNSAEPLACSHSDTPELSIPSKTWVTKQEACQRTALFISSLSSTTFQPSPRRLINEPSMMSLTKLL